MDITAARQVAFNNRFLELIIFITEQCNFRCKYCYEDFTLGRMSPEVILGIKNLILNRAKNGELDILKISWFGGEPLIAKHLIYDLSDFIKNTVNTYNIEYYGTMTTNAYLLTPSVMQTLSDFGITSFQVSLDGIKADHDKTRVRIDGKGTFDKIWQNLIDLSKTNLDFEIVLRVHVHIDNYDNIRQLLNLIAKNFSGDKRFQVFIKGIFGWQGAGDQVKRLVAKQDFYKKIAELKLEVAQSITLYKDNQNRTMCYAAMGNSLAIRANGQIAKCTVALNDERNNIGKINIDGTLDINNFKANKWINGLLINDPDGIRCPMQRMNDYYQ